MGNITSRPDDASNVYLKDQSRLSIKSLIVSNGRQRVILNLAPNSYPATRFVAKKETGDDTPVLFVQDTEASATAFLLRLDLEDELDFRFTFITRQATGSQALPSAQASAAPIDTNLSGLTFAYAASAKELDTLITREFHADPNLHKNSNVQFIGDFATSGSSAIEYDWSWRWRPPKAGEDRGGGWRNTCSFLEYDSRAHRLNTLASFTFWVQNATPMARTPIISSPRLEIAPTPSRHRIASAQSYQSTASDSEAPLEVAPLAGLPPPVTTSEPPTGMSAVETQPSATADPKFVFDVSCQRPGEDMSNVEDGPVFRAAMKSLEQKTGTMRVQIKKVLKRAEAAQQAQVECNEAMQGFLDALQEASSSNASAFKPALDHYFAKISKRILQYERENGELLRKQIMEPLSKLYNLDIKQADSKKRDFEDESRDYYAYMSRYLGQRQDSLKEKKRAESDSKYQSKKKNFELARFDYSSFMQDLHGGRKEQELLSQLTKYADEQAKKFLAAAKKVGDMKPQLDALVKEVSEADKEYRLQRTEREEKRRNLEMNTLSSGVPESEPISHIVSNPSVSTQSNGHGGYASDTDLSRADSTSSQFNAAAKGLSPSNSVLHAQSQATSAAGQPGTGTLSVPSKFKGIRDLEERDQSSPVTDKAGMIQNRKEGLLWALSKPGSHIDPKGMNKQAWHKFWIVLDQGKLSEYSNWKDRLDLHRDPIDLRMASVRMARDAERRFCFEVITPHYRRIYQATTEDEMNHWINAINNALQNAVEGRSNAPSTLAARGEVSKSDYGAVLTGKSSVQPGGYTSTPKSEPHGVNRSSTVGSRPSYMRSGGTALDDNPTKLLDQLRANDQGNRFCADCGSNSRVEWTSINLGIILCIECGGIHRSLGTHVSKIRSLTLDVNSFTNDTVEILMLIGNRISNMIWEARLDSRLKPDPWASRELRLKFITAKYVDRAYVDMTSSQSQFSAVDDNLLTSIKKNDIQGVLSALAQRANVNMHDRSRNTHVVFLALAAADPAQPGSASTSPLASPNPVLKGADNSIKAFPVAELLVQNGAEIPVQLPAFPLSTAAQLYVDQRTARSGNIAVGDTLGPLPNVSTVKMGGEGKLQKRGSAGARLAGKVTGLADR